METKLDLEADQDGRGPGSTGFRYMLCGRDSQMRKLILIFGFLLAGASAYAQIDRGGLGGSVKDSSGLVVPKANIEASQNATGLQRTAATSRSGTFDIPELPLGTYTVKVSADGLQTVTLENVRVSVEHTTILSIILKKFPGTSNSL